MSENPVNVAVIGIPEQEEKRLQAAFKHSETRATTYVFAELNARPDILMVNADEPSALVQWRQYRDRLDNSGLAIPSSVLVSQNREFQTKHYQVRRPLIASRAISILDQVASNELGLSSDVAFSATSQPTSATAGSQPAPSVASSSYAALVVDDSLPVRIQLDQALKRFAEKVDFAETGEEAFELINSNTYDLIFLDVILPGVDGYEICKVIKQGKAKETPVIMLTGNSSPADRIKGKLAGCDTYLIKPVGEAVFQEVVQNYLKKPRAVGSATV
ncbi:twitching motility two-component system response regulator PilG [Methylohalomonas lacus]|uniref:Twitching motility two-component system response regulator PilG n=1 Tax=Methylohalomonas lacus TaxID=398773 RepID=A0AAE3HJP7_9GAMM|nr:response regulator [Methylohalomonas lacus]MCS3902493.1 twitching motility two-component system response regulator PilG [Methylohalomonas lacus]